MLAAAEHRPPLPEISVMFLSKRRTVLSASCTHVEMLVILYHIAVPCKVHARRFEVTIFTSIDVEALLDNFIDHDTTML